MPLKRVIFKKMRKKKYDVTYGEQKINFIEPYEIEKRMKNKI